MAHFIGGQTGFALAALEACFEAMGGFGHPGQCPLRRRRCSLGQGIIHLHHLLVVIRYRDRDTHQVVQVD
jgi:hypothetical protein